ncbi:MAG: hypothetical protein J0M12_14870, partial [Deltaproteobacteria bacterium]|nr:hypothetical protein [Deltaproteobacteria bacterium]
SALAETCGSDATAVLGALLPAKHQRLTGEKLALALTPVILKITGGDEAKFARARDAVLVAAGLRVGLNEGDKRIAALKQELEGKIAEAQAAASAAQAAATTAQAIASRSIWRVLFGLGPAQPKAPKPPKAAKAPKEAKPAADAGKK